MNGVNPGDRPSRLELGRRLVGELPGPVPEAFAAAVRRAPVEPFDFVALQARAERLVDPAPAPAAAAPGRLSAWWGRLSIALAVAAAALLFVQLGPVNRLKGGGVDLDFYVLRDGQPLLGDPDATYRAGDRLQFNYLAGGYDRLVLLSVDGRGVTTVYFPADGDEPVPVSGGGRHILDASIILDDAPGPEVFVAFFGDWTVSEAVDAAEEAWSTGGADTLMRIGTSDPSIATLTIEKDP